MKKMNQSFYINDYPKLNYNSLKYLVKTIKFDKKGNRYEEIIDLNELFYHPNFEPEWFMLFRNRHLDFKWKANSMNPRVNFELLKKFPNMDWNWGKGGLSPNSNLKLEWLLYFKEKSWYWYSDLGISSNPNITLEWLQAFPHKFWDVKYFPFKEHFDIEWFETIPHLNWDWQVISSSPKLKLEWFSRDLNKDWNWVGLRKFPWDWNRVAENKNLIFSWFDKLPNENWNPNFLSINPNLNLEWLERFPDYNWDYTKIRINMNKYDSKIDKTRREHIAAYKIQQWWYKISLSPNYAIGRKLIAKRYDDCFQDN